MSVEVGVELLTAGSCTHPEHVVLRNRRLRPLRFPALSALLHHPTRGPVLYDTGYGERFREATARLPERLYAWVTPVDLQPSDLVEHQLRTRGIHATDVEHLLISHFHADHIAAMGSFERATYHFLEGAARPIVDLGRFAALRRGLLPALLPRDFARRSRAHRPSHPLPALPEFGPLADLFGDGSVFGVPLPGHARGQMGLLVPRPRGRRRPLLLVADAVWTRAAADVRPHPITRLLFDDMRQYEATRQRVRASFDTTLDVVPSHCSDSIATFQRGETA